MLLSLIYFLPCVVSLLWFVSFVLKKKNCRQRLFCYAQGSSAIFYAIMGVYFFPDTDYDTMVRMETVCVPMGVLFPVFMIAYLYEHCFKKHLNEGILHLLYVPAIVFAVVINLIIYIIGFDAAAVISHDFASYGRLMGELDTREGNLYHHFTFDYFSMLTASYVLVLFSLCLCILYRYHYRFGDIFRFFFRGTTSYNSRIVAVLCLAELLLFSILLSLSSLYFSKHMYSGIFFMVVFSVIKHLVAHIEFYTNDDRSVTLYELSHLTLFDYVPEKASDVAVPQSSAVTPEHAQTPAQIKMDKRYEQFCDLMEKKQVWKDEDLTASSVCDMLNIGKTTLSSLLSQYYDMSFRDLVNKYRIEEAKRYMTTNPKATQETVAQHCGFKNAQYFNTQFKKIVGETPAMWMTSGGESFRDM